ncbi:MAG: NUDIX hydrolase [Pirellulales bacterium]|nr:NUDIX hydrolase [Pirellulales bacterium]
MSEPRETLGEGNWLRLVRTGRWEFVERRRTSGVVVIVPRTADGEVLFVEQFRPAIGCTSIELPAGLAGDSDDTTHESLEAAARRELLEETGYAAERMTHLADAPSSSGLTNEIISYYRAEGLRRLGAGGGDAHEQITLHAIPLADCHRWLDEHSRAGRLVATMAYAGLYFLLRPA